MANHSRAVAMSSQLGRGPSNWYQSHFDPVREAFPEPSPPSPPLFDFDQGKFLQRIDSLDRIIAKLDHMNDRLDRFLEERARSGREYENSLTLMDQSMLSPNPLIPSPMAYQNPSQLNLYQYQQPYAPPPEPPSSYGYYPPSYVNSSSQLTWNQQPSPYSPPQPWPTMSPHYPQHHMASLTHLQPQERSAQYMFDEMYVRNEIHEGPKCEFLVFDKMHGGGERSQMEFVNALSLPLHLQQQYSISPPLQPSSSSIFLHPDTDSEEAIKNLQSTNCYRHRERHCPEAKEDLDKLADLGVATRLNEDVPTSLVPSDTRGYDVIDRYLVLTDVEQEEEDDTTSRVSDNRGGDVEEKKVAIPERHGSKFTSSPNANEQIQEAPTLPPSLVQVTLQLTPIPQENNFKCIKRKMGSYIVSKRTMEIHPEDFHSLDFSLGDSNKPCFNLSEGIGSLVGNTGNMRDLGISKGAFDCKVENM